MSRKDIIIISVLVNAGLLAILFVMAINTQDETITQEQAPVQVVLKEKEIPTHPEPEIIPLAVLSSHSQGEDELDKVLKDYSIPSQAEIYDEENPENFHRENEIAQTPPPVIEENDFLEITVKRGDALEKIARANGVSVAAIKKMNKLKSEKISIGQVLKIPKKNTEPSTMSLASAKTPKSPDRANEAENTVSYYTIKSGDNPWKIAKQHHVNFEDLLKLNQLDEEKARNLKIGDKIRVK